MEEIWAYTWKMMRRRANQNKQKKEKEKPHQRVAEKPHKRWRRCPRREEAQPPAAQKKTVGKERSSRKKGEPLSLKLSRINFIY